MNIMPLILLSHFPSAYVGGVKERNQEETRREKGKNYEVSEIYPTIIYESEITKEFYARAMEYILHIQCMDVIHSSIN